MKGVPALLFGLAAADQIPADTLLGVYYGNEGFKMEQVQAMEAWQAKKHAVVNLFAAWNSTSKVMKNLFSLQLPALWNNGNVPMVTWQPYTSQQTPGNVEALIAKGDYDAYIGTWADKMKGFLAGPDQIYGNADDRRVYLRLAHEMNGDWYPWGAAVGNNLPGDYQAMWRRVWDIFASKGMDHTRLQWVWSVNAEDFGGFPAEEYYPGDAYVDWIAIDGYNWGNNYWTEPAPLFDDMVWRLRALTSKPLAITEFGSTSSTATGTDVSAKSQWITGAFEYVQAHDIRMAVWFNVDKERDWASFGGSEGTGTFRYNRTTYKTYPSYKDAIGGGGFMPSDQTNPRLLTDLQFFGQ